MSDKVCKKENCASCKENCVWKPVTKADQIRSMTDEQLAYFINEVEVEAIRRAGLYLTAKQIVNAQADRLEWLRTIDRIEG